MLFFLPQRFAPAQYNIIRKRYWNESVSWLLLLTVCGLYSVLAGDISRGVIDYGWWRTLRMYLHGGTPMCPLCGGVRSFLFILRGELITALHFSISGVFCFLAGTLNCVVKMLLLQGKDNIFLQKSAAVADSRYFLLIMIFFCWGLQLLLHYGGVFSWYTVLYG